jgi:hemerythrin-like domain-containing protein
MTTSHITTDHEVIQNWAKDRGGKPAEVEGTGDDRPGVLRIEFPQYDSNEKLKRLQWPSFFKKFDAKGLGFLYQDRTDRGQVSRFCKFVYAPQGVLGVIHEEHEKVRSILEDMASSTTNAVKTRPRLIESLREALLPHMAGEEKVVYKALKKQAGESNLPHVLEAYEEHRHARSALQRLEKADPESVEWDARCKVLKELIEHHIEEEEGELFDLARDLLGGEGLNELDEQYKQKEEKKLQKVSS